MPHRSKKTGLVSGTTKGQVRKTARKAYENPWISHVKKVKAQKGNQGKSLKEILKLASKSYKKK